VSGITKAPLGAAIRRARGQTTRGGPAARTRGRIAGAMAAGAVAALALPGLASAAVTAPHNVIAFPQRDFVSASGFARFPVSTTRAW